MDEKYNEYEIEDPLCDNLQTTNMVIHAQIINSL